MSNVATLPIEADRYGACVRQIFIRGMDLTGVVMRAQVRLIGDTPGSPLVDLQTVTNGNAEGLRLVGVDTVDGLPVSHVELVINETTLEGLPYAGELGSPTQLLWDWQIILAGRKQRIARGEFTITGDGVTGADYAPTNRPQAWSRSFSPSAGMRTGATLTFGDEIATITIDGANLLAPLAAQAQDALDRINEFTTGPTGPAANTRLNLAALKAAAITDLASQWDGSTWFWTPGDFTGQADDVSVVKANSTALTVGAWVRGTDPADTRVNILRFIPRNLWPSIIGRTVNNTIADAQALTTYMRKAMAYAAATRRRLFIPAGLYNIAPVDSFAAEGGACQRCFPILSYMDLDAEAGASFRIVDGVSTDANVVFMCMFGTNQQLQNVSWRGLDMDMNGQRNPISPNRANGVYTLVNQAMIFVSGTISGRAARINNALVTRCGFYNTPGVSCIVMGQSNVRDSGLGSGWQVHFNRFRNGGLDTNDHSAIYAWARDVSAVGNDFENDVQFGPTGGLVAFEVHGSATHFTGNRICNFFQGMWIDGNYTEPVKGVIIEGNRFLKMGAFGILYFGVSSDIAPVTQTNISNNVIEFDNLPQPGIDRKIGIGTTGNYSQVDGLISGNRIASSGTAIATSAISFAAGVIACGSAWKRDPVSGVIGVEKGPLILVF